MKKLVIGVVTLVVLAAGALPPVFGWYAERTIREQLAAAPANPQFDIAIGDYERGAYASTATLKLSLDAGYGDAGGGFGDLNDEQLAALDPGTRLLLTLFAKLGDGVSFDIDIVHGPLAFDEGLFVGLYRTNFELNAADGELRELQDTLQLPYLVRTRADAGFAGTLAAVTDIPAIDYSDGPDRLRFSGMEVLSDIDLKTSRGSYSGGITEFSGSFEGTDFAIEGISGRGEFELLTDLISLGSGVTTVDTMQITGGGAPPIKMTALEIDGSITLDDAREYVDVGIAYGVESLTGIEGHTLSDARLELGVQHIDRTAFEDYVRATQEADPFDPSAAQAAQEAMAISMLEMLAGSPSLTIRPLQFSWDGLPFFADINIDVDGAGLPAAEELANLMMTRPDALLAALSGKARIEAAEPLAREMATAITRNQLTAMVTPDMELSPADIERQAAQQSTVLLSSLVAQGMLVVEGETLKSAIEYADGLLTINDQPIPLGGAF